MPNLLRKRISPTESAKDIIEIRTSRYLRIQHHNARPRDDIFKREMENFQQYKKNGIISSGPLTMSKRLTSNIHQTLPGKPPLPPGQDHARISSKKNEEEKDSHKEVIDVNDLVREESQSIEDYDLLNYNINPSLTSSITSTPCHANLSSKVQSASSVLVGLRTSNPNAKVESEHLKSEDETLTTANDIPLFKKTSDKPFMSQSDPQQNLTRPINSPTHSNHSLEHNIQSPGKTEKNTPRSNRNVASTVNKDIVLFFIHGVGGSSDVWNAQINYFALKGYEIIAPDLIGHGFSCCPQNARAYHFKEIALDVEEIFDRYCKKKNVVIGHSYGLVT